MDNTRGWTFTIGLLVIFALVGIGIVWGVWSLVGSVQRTVSPVESMTGNMATQVASILHPTPTVLPNPMTVIRDIRSLARLETIQYTVEKVITAETGQGLFSTLFGDRMLFVARGTVVAGVDMARLGPDDLKVENGVLYVRLPEPEVFVATLDNDKSYVYNRDTGLFTKGDINLETTARQAAENEIEKAALEDGILKLARQNAENYMYRLFRQLNYPEVIFIGGSETPTATP
jgi:hypothetical protein